MIRPASPQRHANLAVIGSGYNVPADIGVSMVTVSPGGMATFETLYSFTGPAGSTILARYPGSYGSLAAAGRS